jgi:hypothetical protein
MDMLDYNDDEEKKKNKKIPNENTIRHIFPGRPERTTKIDREDVYNLIIALNTSKSFNVFLNSV